jgi:hypothetical protein
VGFSEEKLLMGADGYPFVKQQEDIMGKPLCDVTNVQIGVLLAIRDISELRYG